VTEHIDNPHLDCDDCVNTRTPSPTLKLRGMACKDDLKTGDLKEFVSESIKPIYAGTTKYENRYDTITIIEIASPSDRGNGVIGMVSQRHPVMVSIGPASYPFS